MKGGIITMQYFLGVFLIYTLFFSVLATAANVSLEDNLFSNPDSLEKITQKDDSTPQEDIEQKDSSDEEKEDVVENETQEDEKDDIEEIVENEIEEESQEENETIIENAPENVSVEENITEELNFSESFNETYSNESFSNESFYNETFENKTEEEIQEEGGFEEVEKELEEEYREELIQGIAEIEEEVSWIKRVYTENESYEIEIPEGATKIREKFFRKEENSFKSISSFSIQVEEEENESYIEVEYETSAPKIEEKDLVDGKEVLVWAEEHYENVIAFTQIDEALEVRDEKEISIYWVEEDKKINPRIIKDLDNNGIYDYVSWVVPHLSNQTFQIIVVNIAEHLDENRNFVEDIYESIKEQDGIWSPIINDDEYVRIVFEKELDSSKDITIVPRVILGHPIVEVYEKDSSIKLEEFSQLIDNIKNKIYLTNLDGLQDTFDLKVVNGSVQFDYIVDPVTVETADSDAFNYLVGDGTIIDSGSYLQTQVDDNDEFRVGYQDATGAIPVDFEVELGFDLSSFGISGSDILNITVDYSGCWTGGTGSDCGTVDQPEFASGTDGEFRIYLNGADKEQLDCVSSECESTNELLLGDYNSNPSWGIAYNENAFQYQKVGGFENTDLSSGILTLVLKTNGTNYANAYEVEQRIDYVGLTLWYNSNPSSPTQIKCNGGSCQIIVDSNVELNCSGSTDPDGDDIDYYINYTSGDIGSHSDGGSYLWDTSLVSDVVGINFSCYAQDSNGGVSGFYFLNSDLIIDHTYPLIDYSSGTLADGESVNANYIYINLSVSEDNFENITFYLYDENNFLIKNKSYTTQTFSHTFSNLADGEYNYNVTIFDEALHSNTTETRSLTLDKMSPVGETLSPSSGSHSNSRTQNLTLNAEDSNGLKEVILNIFNESGFKINETSILVTGTAITIGVIYNFLTDGIYSWFYKIIDLADNYYLTSNSTIVIDTNAPNISLESILNNSGDVDGNLNFAYNVSDELSDIVNCSLILNEEVYETNTIISKNVLQSFDVEDLGIGSYNFSIKCFDEANNFGDSELRYFDVVSVENFNGDIPDFANIDLTNVSNFVLENLNYGKLIYNEEINILGAFNFDSLVEFSLGGISVDSESFEGLNNSATIELYNLDYEFVPVILKNGVLCEECFVNNYSNGDLSFNVTSFSSYTLSENSKLEIYDETESIDKYSGDNVKFSANYTNRTSGVSISLAFCNITFSDEESEMAYNFSSGLFEYDRSFSIYGMHSYEVDCYGSANRYENLTSSDSAAIKLPSVGSPVEGYRTQSGIYYLEGLDEFIELDYPVNDLNHAFVIAPNQMNQEDVAAATSGDPATNSDDAFVSLYLYNETHIRAQRTSEDDGTMVVTWQVLEAMNEEFEVQRGGTFYSGTSVSVTDTIPNFVNVENSMSWFYINTSYTSNAGDAIQFYSNITNENTIEFIRETGTSLAVNFRWVVVEWNMDKIAHFQKGYTGDITGDDTAADCFNIGETVDKSTSFLFHQSHSTHTGTGGLDSSTRAGYIYDNNNVCFYDYDGSNTAGVKWYVVDFGEAIGREEGIQTDWASDDYSDDVSFSGSYQANNSLFFVSGTCNGDGTAKPRHTQWSYLTGGDTSTGIHIERTYGGQNREYAWQILELPYYENLDVPQFSNYQSNESYAKQSESVRFSLSVTDSGDSLNWVRGIVEGMEVNFTQGTGDEWYYDYVCTENKVVNFSYVSAEDNGYPLMVNSTSINGIGVVCDLVTPVVSFVSPDTPQDGTGSNDDSIEIDVEITENNFESIKYELYNSSGLVNSTTYFSKINTITFRDLDSATYYYNVSVYDLAGNIGSTATRTVTLDRDLPVVNYGEGTSDDGIITKGNSIFINVTVVENNLENISFYLYDENMQVERSVLDHNQNYVEWTLLEDGDYYYEVVVWDSYGNMGKSSLRSITLDNIGPVINYIGLTEDDDSYFPRNYIYVSTSVTEENFENITFNLYEAGILIDNTTFENSVRSINWPSLSDGEYQYNVSVWDKAGNLGSSLTRTITLDNINPVVGFGSGTADDNSNFSRNYIYVNASVNEINFKNITFYLYDEFMNKVGSQSFSDSTREYTFSDLLGGIYYYNISVYDLSGNLGSSPTRKIGLDTVGPVVDIVNPKAIAYGVDSGLALDYVVKDEISQVDSCWWNLDYGTNNSISCGTNTTFGTDDGQHILTFYSNDTFGHIGKDSVSFLVSTGGPAIVLNSPENDTIYSSSQEVLFNYSATDIQGVSSCSLYGSWNGGWHLNQTDSNWIFGDSGYDFEDWESYSDSDTALSGSVWQNVAGDDCDMMTDSAGTPSSNTGPNIDQTLGTTAGEYLYLETSSGYCMGDGLYSELNGSLMMDADLNEYNVTFWYHMYGSTIGSLNLDVFNGTWQNNYWSISGQQHTSTTDPYTQATVDLSEFSGNIYVRFRFISGGNYYGDIAVDDLRIQWSPRAIKETSNFTVNLSEEGNYEWNIECNDTLNLKSTAIDNFSIGVDLTAPIVNFGSLTYENDSRIGEEDVFVEANITEINLANVTFDLYKNTKIKTETYTNGRLNHTFSELSDGIYYYNITAYDKSGRAGVSETRKIEIDTTVPTATLNSPTNGYFTNSVTHNFTATVNDLVELKDATLFILNSTGGIVYTFLIGLAGLTSATIGQVYTFLYDDVFTWFYQVTDSVGNEYNTTSNSIEIDSTAPVITFISPTQSNGQILLQNYIFVNVSLYEKNFANLTFVLYNDEGIVRGPNTFLSSTRSVNWTLLPDDKYYYNVTSYDLAGNKGISSTRTITLDTTSPIVNFASNSAGNNSVVSGDTIFMNVSVVESNEANITFYLYDELGSLEGIPKTFTDSRRSVPWNLLSEGIYYYNVTVYDKVSLGSSTETRKVSIDNTLPVINYVSPTENDYANKNQDWIFVNTSIEEDNFANITFYLYDELGSLLDENVFSNEIFEYNFTGLNDGAYYYNVTIYDKAGHSSSLSTRQILLDTNPADVNFVFPTEDDETIVARDWVYLNLSVDEDNFKEIIFRLYDSGGLYQEQSFTSLVEEYNFTNLPDNNYQYNASVYDLADNVGNSETRNIGLDSAGPIVEILKPKSKTYGYNESLDLEHSVSDVVSNVDSCWWNLDDGINNSVSCNVATTFNTSVDSHVLNFYANDTFGNIGFDSVEFFISITGPAIELVSPEDEMFYSSATNINFSFLANDPDSVDTCSLYGDWGTGWELNETYSGGWKDVGFKHRKDIFVENIGSSELENYPLYLNISSEYTESGDFSDLRFFNGSCSEEQELELNYEKEYYDINSADVWVNIPNIFLEGSSICMYYQNNDAEDLEGGTDVWNSNYGIVYHMDEEGQDSTSNNRDRVADVGSPVNHDSFLGEGLLFSSGNAWDMSDLSYWEQQWDVRSHEVIFETSSDIFTRQALFAEGGGTNGILMYIFENELYVRWWSESDGMSGVYLSEPISANTKYHAVMSYSYPGNYELFLNGELVASGTTTTGISSHSGNGGIAYENTAKDYHDGSNSDNYFLGSIFELRILDIAMTEDLANQTYSSILNENSVVSFGEEENFTAFNVLISEEGSYEWNVECNDTIGYYSFALENNSFVVDVTNPQVFFVSPTEDSGEDVGRNWIYAKVSVVENNFENITFNLYNSSGSKVKTSSFSDSTRQINWTGLSSGIYYYNVSVYDKANRRGESETRNINLDLSAPTGTLETPTHNSFTNNLIQNLTGTFSDATGLLNATLYIFNQTGNLIFTSFVGLAGVTLATVGIIYNFVEEGIYSWFYSVEDVVGNVYNTGNNTLNIDLTSPLIEYSLGTEISGQVFERENIYVNVSVIEENLDNITFNLYDLEGQVYAHSFGSSEINWTLLADGTYYYNVTAYDIAGNFNTTETRNITLDNNPPVIEFISPTKEDGDFISGDTISVYVYVEEPNEANITFYLYNETGSLKEENVFTDSRRSISWNLLEEGTYYYNVTVYDLVGKYSSTETRYIIIDDTSPVLTYAYGTENNDTSFARDWIYFKINSVEDNFENITLFLYNSTGLVSSRYFIDTTREYNFTGLSDGIYYYNATMYDKAGNSGSVSTRNILLDNVAPIINFDSGTLENNVNNTNNWIYADVAVTEDNFGSIVYELRNSDGIVDSTSYTSLMNYINWTSLASKEYWYNVTVYDKAGNKDSTEVRKIGLDYLAPTIQLINPKAKAYGVNVSLPLDYNVNDNLIGVDSCWYNLDLGSNVSVDCEGSSTFDTSNGQHVLHFYSNDSFGNLAYKNVTFLISTTGPAIQLIAPNDNSFYSEATEIFFEYSAEDPDLTESCSLYGSWNGGWHLNQTDFSWIVGDWGEIFDTFEDSSGWNWTQSTNDDCDWSRNSDGDGTPSGNTGPEEDHTLGTINGHFLFIEASAGNACGYDQSSPQAILESEDLDADSNNYNVSFWFHMYGANMGNLYLEVNDSSGWNTIWSQIGQNQTAQADDYIYVSKDLSDYEGTIKLRFRTITGSNYDSDISIDDLNISYVPGMNKEVGNFSLNISEEGTHDWNIKCNDTKGYDTWAVSNYSITFDVTNPIVDFGENTLEDEINVSQDFIYVNSSIIETNFENITFYLYDESYIVSQVSFNDSTRDYAFTNLDDGVYYYNITVYDSAARSGSSSTRKIMLDTTSPTGSLISPSSGKYVNNASQNLTATFSDENGLVEAILYIFNGTTLVDSFVMSISGTTVIVGYVYTFLVDGIYSWFYQAEDSVGNLYNTTSNSLIIDTTLPLIDFVGSTEENNTYISQDFIYANVSVIEENFRNISFDLSGKKVSKYTFTNSKRDINWTLLSDGVYYYKSTVTDLAGNTNESETRKITLDNVLPVVSYVSPTENNYANKSQDWIYVNLSITELNLDEVKFRLYNDSGLINESIFSELIQEINWTGLDDGHYWYNVSVLDLAGNRKDLSTRNIFLDTVTPLVSIQSSTEGTLEQEWIYVNAIVGEDNFKEIKFNLYDENGLINQTIYNTLIENINFSVSSENKTYYYNVSVSDWAGNVGTSSTKTVNLIDVTFPYLNLISPKNETYSYANGLRLSYDANDVHLEKCWYSLNDISNITLPGCNDISINVADEEQHTLKLYANDTMGYLSSDEVSFSVNSSLINTPTYKVLRDFAFVNSTTDVEIPQTDMSKAFIMHTVRSSDNSPKVLQVTSDFVNSNYISFENYGGSQDAIVEYSVISGPNISVQRGEIAYTDEGGLNAEINSVDLSKSFVIVNNRLDSGTSADNVDGFWTGGFEDDNTLIFKRGENSSSGVLSWQVVEWEGINSQRGELTIADSETINTTGISEVDLSNSFLIFSNNLKDDESVQDVFVRGDFVDSSSLEFERVGDGGEIEISWFVLESSLFDVERGDYTHVVNGNPQYIDLSSELINVSRSFDLHSHQNYGTSTVFSGGFVTQTIYDNDSLVLQKGFGSSGGETSWFAIEILDLNSPEITLEFPLEYYNYSSYTIPSFSFEVEDESQIKNCSLYGSWNGGWHLNQTVYLETDFSGVIVNQSGFYDWGVECYDIYGNYEISENRTFGAFLPPTRPELLEINQTSNDGTGDIVLDWGDSENALTYRIYSGTSIDSMSVVAEVSESNYTDISFAGNKRKFYSIEAWNPSGENETLEVIGAHVYTLKHNPSVIGTKDRNWIAFPTNFSNVQTANETLNEMTGVTAVTRLNTETQTRVTCNEFSCPESFACTQTNCNFDIDPGVGYEVSLNSSGAEEVNWSGVGTIYSPQDVIFSFDEANTRFNNNWLAIYANSNLETARDLALSIGVVDSVTRWNEESQTTEGLVKLNPIIYLGNNFDLEMEKAYEVSVTEDKIWRQE